MRSRPRRPNIALNDQTIMLEKEIKFLLEDEDGADADNADTDDSDNDDSEEGDN